MKKWILTAAVLCGVAILALAPFAAAQTNGPVRAAMKEGDRLAVLVVHFGTTNDPTRAATIEALNGRVREALPDAEVREAFTSRIVIRRLAGRGIERLNPARALARLAEEGFTHVLVQPSTVIDGVEMESIRKDVAGAAAGFAEIRVGDPLLYAPRDYAAAIDAVTAGADPGKAYILVGHGTDDPSTAQYAMLDHMLAARGHRNFTVGTIEGYPGLEHVVAWLKASPKRPVVLVPFMFVAGEHANNDIAVEWRGALERAGYTVEVRMEGLGQNAAIQEIYLAHLRSILEGRRMGIMEKKAIYEATGEKMED